MPGDLILYKLYRKLEESKKAAIDFWAKEKEINDSKSVVKKSTFKVKRFFIYAPDYTTKFKELSDSLDKIPEQLKKIKELSRTLLEPTALAYRNEFVNAECRKFWIAIAGTEIGSGQDRWSRFQSKYKLVYHDSKKWTPYDWDCIRSVACNNGYDLTLFGFIDLTNNAGFPIDLDQLPSVLDSNHSVNDKRRIEVGKMINELIREFYTKEFYSHITNVIRWYSSFDRDQLKHLIIPEKENETEEEKKLRQDKVRKDIKQFKACECYKIIKRIRDEDKPCDQWTDREKLAQDVEKARRVVSFFYLQFMVICEFGRLSENILKNIDFPGKARIKAFIGDNEPLDYAYYHIFIKGGRDVDPSIWEEKKPKLYGFLEGFIESTLTLDQKKDKLKKKEIDLDARERFLSIKLDELRLKEEIFNEKEKKLKATYAKIEADLKAKEVINKFQKGIFLSKRKEEKFPKTTKNKVKEDAQKIFG